MLPVRICNLLLLFLYCSRSYSTPRSHFGQPGETISQHRGGGATTQPFSHMQHSSQNDHQYSFTHRCLWLLRPTREQGSVYIPFGSKCISKDQIRLCVPPVNLNWRSLWMRENVFEEFLSVRARLALNSISHQIGSQTVKQSVRRLSEPV